MISGKTGQKFKRVGSFSKGCTYHTGFILPQIFALWTVQRSKSNWMSPFIIWYSSILNLSNSMWEIFFLDCILGKCLRFPFQKYIKKQFWRTLMKINFNTRFKNDIFVSIYLWVGIVCASKGLKFTDYFFEIFFVFVELDILLKQNSFF